MYKKVIIRILITLAAGSILVMLLWNWLMTSIFELRSIHLGEAAGLLVLSQILLGRFGFWGSKRMMPLGRHHHFREKWKNMTPEQRKEFIEARKHQGFKGHHRNKGYNA